MDTILTNVKAIAASLGAMVTGLLGSGLIPADTQERTILVVIGIIATALTTAAVPNVTKAAAARRAAKQSK